MFIAKPDNTVIPMLSRGARDPLIISGGEMKEGDIFYSLKEDGKYSIGKILKIQNLSDEKGGPIYHCLLYNNLKVKPVPGDVPYFSIFVYHVPLDANSFDQKHEVLCSIPVNKSELRGYVDYVKHTDFNAYLTMTNQSADTVIAKAQGHFSKALESSKKKRYEEAIREYTRAFEEFPVYYEALDNRGFVKMDMGRFEDAIKDFELSLKGDNNNFAAYFSTGECHLKLGRIDQADKIFNECISRWPKKTEIPTLIYKAKKSANIV